jgi:hypothetical protein
MPAVVANYPGFELPCEQKMAVEELLKHVRPDAVYCRVPLPDDQNALTEVRQ